MTSRVSEQPAHRELSSDDIDRASRRVIEKFARAGKELLIERDGEIIAVPATDLLTWVPEAR